MNLALCIIIEGDEKLKNLQELLLSVNGVFQSIHVTANGENTTETEKWCKKVGIDYTFLKWNDDFSEQRNYNFSRVPKNTDYIVWADSDDVIVNPHLLHDIAHVSKKKEYDVVFFTYWYGNKFDGEPHKETFVENELSQMRERMIRPGSITWKKRIHETPVPIDDSTFKYSQVKHSKEYPIAWMHLGADRDMPKDQQELRMARNRRLLELELEDERSKGDADPRTLLYLMKIYAEYEDDAELLKKCLEMGKEYLSKSGWDQERGLCLQLMSRCIGNLGDYKKARDFIHDAIKEYPYDPLLYLYLARVYFNLNDFRAMKYWMDVALKMDLEENNSAMNKILELKVLSSELLLRYYLNAEKNVRKAYESARLLNKVNPTESNKQNEEYLFNQKELDIASEHAHKLMNYYRDIGREHEIPRLIDSLPDEIKRLPFAVKYYNRFKEPKRWESNEICYFANFGGDHLEKWNGHSIDQGIGGSETAVIRLSEEWVKKGYKVTVYGDPRGDEGVINGVTYLPWYKFNQKDKFNIFIQWRSNSMAGKVNAKQFYVDLHDVFFEDTQKRKADHVDKFMVKSKYHRNLGKNIPDEKFKVVSNGI